MDAVGVEKVSFEEAFRQADFLSINLKGCDENLDKVNAAAMALMKPSAWIINTSRGKLIDEDALIAAVKAGTIAGAILDVIKVEPPTGSEPILHCPGIYVTPHVSYISVESFRALKERALENLGNMLDGKRPRDLVN
jgi:D-3-phosphoglycerate dehydrogenase